MPAQQMNPASGTTGMSRPTGNRKASTTDFFGDTFNQVIPRASQAAIDRPDTEDPVQWVTNQIQTMYL